MLLITSVSAQIPNWAWAKSIGGSGNETAHSLSTDFNGNVYAAGIFDSSSLLVGSDTLHSFSASPFLIKYDANGNIIWARSAIGQVDITALSSATDIFGNTYVAGAFISSITFDTITLNSFFSSSDIFIVKYDDNGNVLWAKRAGGSSADRIYALTTDASGNIYLGGYFNGPAFFFASDTLYCPLAYDMFVAKYDNNGNELWAKNLGSSYSETRSLTTDAFGNVYVTGAFGYPLLFGNDSLTTAGNWDVFILKYNSSGNEIWARSAGSINEDRATSIVSDSQGNAYISGFFWGNTLRFGTDSVFNYNNISNTSDDIFIAKYDNNGNVQWAKSAGGVSNDEALSASCDAMGNVSLTGLYASNTVLFDTIAITKPVTDPYNVFVVNYDSNGNAAWAKKSTGTVGYDRGEAIATDNFGNVYIGGHFNNSPFYLGSTFLYIYAGTDMFIAKIGTITGLDESEINNTSLTLTPNPATSACTITLNNTSTLQHPNTLTLYDVTGRALLQQPFTSSPHHLNIASLKSGMYVVEVSDNKGTSSRAKLIKE